MRFRFAALVVFLSTATAASASLAQAQEAPAVADTERARTLFEEGVGHVDAGEWEQAAGKFREALSLRDAPAVRYNLASALVALEQYTEAESIARPLLDDPTTDAELRARTEELLAQVARAAGLLTIDVRGATGGVTVRIDGEAVDASSIVHSFSLSPRGYTVVVERHGREIERRDVNVTAGQNAQVSVAVAPSAEETAIAAEGGAPGETPAGDGGDELLTDWRFWTAVGAAVVLAVVLAVVASQ